MITISPLDFKVGEIYIQEVNGTPFRMFICTHESSAHHFYCQQGINIVDKEVFNIVTYPYSIYHEDIFKLPTEQEKEWFYNCMKNNLVVSYNNFTDLKEKPFTAYLNFNNQNI